ncbi:hypothetical protein FF011L_51520 [Roseimaritima multifibrata]|uniref:Uncharacterized protein n=1 Tax=Roseimaritima multifibrata TaxID=1930274 RepID=A0A517MNA1_9BACT|nr:hypothetical protein FF011L_51520 [Roseimaritima multifibrata]
MGISIQTESQPLTHQTLKQQKSARNTGAQQTSLFAALRSHQDTKTSRRKTLCLLLTLAQSDRAPSTAPVAKPIAAYWNLKINNLRLNQSDDHEL